MSNSLDVGIIDEVQLTECASGALTWYCVMLTISVHKESVSLSVISTKLQYCAVDTLWYNLAPSQLIDN